MYEIVSKAPGKMFFFGEYAVLYGYPAISIAVDRHVTVKIKEGRRFLFTALGRTANRMKEVKEISPHAFIIMKHYSSEFGLEINSLSIEIESTIPFKGLGSSGALMVALAGALHEVIGIKEDREKMLERLFRIKLQIERGSPVDIATSLFGGILKISYDKEGDIFIDKLPYEDLSKHLDLYAIYSGEKMLTSEAVKVVEARRKESAVKETIDLMGRTTETTVKYWSEIDMLYRLARLYHYLLASLGVSTKDIDRIVDYVEERGGIAKISGSGFGDCVLALIPKEYDIGELEYSYIKFRIDEMGLQIATKDK